MADIDLVENEFGDNYDITIKDNTGTVVDLTPYTSANLEIKTLDFVITKLTKTLSIVLPATSGKVRWAIVSGDVPTVGDYIAQVTLTGVAITRKTFTLNVSVYKDI